MQKPNIPFFTLFNRNHLVALTTAVLLAVVTSYNAFAQQANVRQDISLDKNWRSIVDEKNQNAYQGFENSGYNDKEWKQVNVPHNWDDYEGYRRMRHGNLHGYAWYRKTFEVAPQKKGQRYFLFFEGVGSYATVWLNGKKVGYHAGGRTTFTLDVTDAINLANKPNVLAVRADHPAEIRDLPWVCGGCSDERGFSEGSQPMGIFRPVHLLVTDPVRVEPFGVHIWTDSTLTEKAAQAYINTEVKNYGEKARKITVINRLVDKTGATVAEAKTKQKLQPGKTTVIKQKPASIANPHLWSIEDPYLYTLVTEVVEKNKTIDRITTPYGFRWISWPIYRADNDRRFFLNGKPVFINGIAEYEHLLGNSHAFSEEQIRSRVLQMKAAGFNSFRDGHQPHNLRYNKHWDELGILLWTQHTAHIWFDTPEFRENFKQLLVDWVKERRNSPSVVLWGLQNESTLPEEFARECTQLIRELDPTSPSQRLVTTCNGGEGTDWNVPQNWTGTYGGNPATYDEDVKRQVLIGEYGAWRTLDLHTEGPFVQDGAYSEDRMTQLMEMKVRLAEEAKDSTSGHYFWLFTSHDNPGRVQGGEGLRELDRIGPVNYKGTLTPWEEPLDVYYMFRSNYAPKDNEPMVYIASHTWPDRWTTPGKKDGVVVYSNCDEVELFNDVNARSLGKRKRSGGTGTHFTWDGVDINYNVLYAVGYVNGKPVAKDYIVLHHLPQAPNFNAFYKEAKPLLAPAANMNYLYRVNCGGPAYTDKQGNTWMADVHKTTNGTWGSKSWTDDFTDLPPYFASQRHTHDPINGTDEWPLFQKFRYGLDKLRYEFPVPDGEYLVELYFTEPWLGTGGGLDATGWRLFDVAVNDKTVIENLDIWKEVGHDGALKKTVKAQVTGGQLVISFPRAASGQAIISAIAIASANKNSKAAAPSPAIIQDLATTDNAMANNWTAHTWLDTGYKQYLNADVAFTILPADWYGAEWIKTPATVKAGAGINLAQFKVSQEADVYVGIDGRITQKPAWLQEYEDTKSFIYNTQGTKFHVYKKRFPAGATVTLGANGKIPSGNPAMYSVAVTKAANIDPAYDLKSTIKYNAIAGRGAGAELVKEQVNNKDVFTFKTKSANNAVEWDFKVGVADIYALEVRYHNPNANTFTGKLQLFSVDGTLMKEETVEFTSTRPTKWNYINTTTGSMVNAGQYKVRITSTEAENVSFYDLAVQ
ncbi:malectin domain-containing carbohydrate-binding protein [Botryobacter ruber]|uniref:malectin domain-containing carbohydrate-binding protein n=1 Tax=Botryobacter ruber TaxID=2171629 RepID=UPI000E0BF1A2|nr:malectin domain-containing carbohydrate-binding protein [Botryobacter ruber]